MCLAEGFRSGVPELSIVQKIAVAVISYLIDGQEL